jgi:hypothetical protein
MKKSHCIKLLNLIRLQSKIVDVFFNSGKIWAESLPAGQVGEVQDRGSRFIIEIPLVQSEELMKRWG